MATITTLASSTGRVGTRAARHGQPQPYVVQKEIDLAAAVTAKGSALAQGDIIEAISVPAETYVLGATVKKTSAMTGTSTDLTFDVGVTGVDADVFVDGWDFDAATVGTYPQQPAAFQPVVVGASADTIDILFATQTGTVTGGKILVTAVLLDIAPISAPGATF